MGWKVRADGIGCSQAEKNIGPCNHKIIKHKGLYNNTTEDFLCELLPGKSYIITYGKIEFSKGNNS